MRICYDKAQFDAALGDALEASEGHPVLLDKFLVGAVEYDVDALCDGSEVYIAGIMEHIEAAGVHSGDSTALMPPVHLSDKNKTEVENIVTRIALKLGVVGLVNVQLAIQDGVVYIIEVNPRASRTVPYVSKATGVPVAQIATRLMLGEKLRDVGPLNTVREGMSFIKSPVFPWKRFAGADIVLGPEMRSTGEVMGIGRNFGEAYAKGLMGSGMALPKSGGVFLSIRDEDKHRAPNLAKKLSSMGFKLVATGGTHRVLLEAGVESEFVYKVKEGRPDIVDSIKNGKIQLMLNTPMGKKSALDERAMRLAGLRYDVPCITTIEAADALIDALVSLRAGDLKVVNVQELQS